MGAGNDPVEPKWLAALGRATDIAIIACGALLCVLVFANVLSRFIFNFDIAWSNELAIFVMVWATFLGGAAAQRKRGHMRVGELVEKLRGRWRIAVEAAVNVFVVALLGVVVWYGAVIAERTMAQEMTVLYWPVGLIYAAMPVGTLLTATYLVADTVLLLSGRATLSGPAASGE